MNRASFQFIQIPTALFHDENLEHKDLILLGWILSLSRKQGYCFASNNKLMEFAKMSASKVARSMRKLRELGYVKINYSGGRRIFINEDRLSKGVKSIGLTLKNLNSPVISDNQNRELYNKEKNKKEFFIKSYKIKNKNEFVRILKSNRDFRAYLFPQAMVLDHFKKYERFQSSRINDRLYITLGTITKEDSNQIFNELSEIGLLKYLETRINESDLHEGPSKMGSPFYERLAEIVYSHLYRIFISPN